jgi:hypothetical protein
MADILAAPPGLTDLSVFMVGSGPLTAYNRGARISRWMTFGLVTLFSYGTNDL